MKLLQLLDCARGKHMRSRGRAWNDGTTFRSTCSGCGKPMVRTPGGWQIAPKGDR